MKSFKPGDYVVCELDSRTYEIVWIKDRNTVEKSDPESGPKLLGNIVLLQDSLGNKVHAYEWEIHHVKKD